MRSTVRQESHRVYLQQFTDRKQEQQQTINATSVAVRLSERASCKQLTELLRQKLNLSPLTNETTLQHTSESFSPLDRINEKLGRKNPNIVKEKYDPNKHDALVLVASYSIPKAYLHFEHETNYQGSAPSEAFNLFRTISPNENPLLVRDELVKNMTDIIEEAEMISASSSSSWKSVTSSPSRSPMLGAHHQPAVRLFFMPRYNSGVSNATIDIEGYCSGLESLSDDDEDYDLDLDPESDGNILHTTASLIGNTTVTTKCSPTQPSDREAWWIKERHLKMILSSIESSSDDTICGYLLRQSRDPNIWKRVHCVLTTTQLWFVSRVHHVRKYACAEEEETLITGNQIGKHHVIDLVGTLLIEPIDEMSPLRGIPFTFDMTTKEGKRHIFRASSRNSYQKWMHFLSERIIQCQENSYFELAESMILQRAKQNSKAFEETLSSSKNIPV